MPSSDTTKDNQGTFGSDPQRERTFGGRGKKLRIAVQVAELDLDCAKCNDNQKKLYGCTEPPLSPSTWPFKGEFLDRCPMRFITRDSVLYIKYFGFFKQGFLVNDGALGHQPAKMVDAFAVIEDEKYHVAKEKAEGK